MAQDTSAPVQLRSSHLRQDKKDLVTSEQQITTNKRSDKAECFDISGGKTAMEPSISHEQEEAGKPFRRSSATSGREFFADKSNEKQRRALRQKRQCKKQPPPQKFGGRGQTYEHEYPPNFGVCHYKCNKKYFRQIIKTTCSHKLVVAFITYTLLFFFFFFCIGLICTLSFFFFFYKRVSSDKRTERQKKQARKYGVVPTPLFENNYSKPPPNPKSYMVIPFQSPQDIASHQTTLSKLRRPGHSILADDVDTGHGNDNGHNSEQRHTHTNPTNESIAFDSKLVIDTHFHCNPLKTYHFQKA
ncbi:hypothetical protein RFI_01722, partial [Reticulomyxa filosa]